MSTTTAAERRVRRARNGVAYVFALNGFAFASWAARLPTAQSQLGLSPGQLGLLLLALSSGVVIALPMAGAVVHRIGAARTVTAGGVLVTFGLALVGIGVGTYESTVMTAIGLFVIGWGTSSWDVAMNVEAAEVERALGRTIMPRFHAGFSIGTVLGAATGAVVARADLGLDVHLTVVALCVLASVRVPGRTFLAASDDDEGDAGTRTGVLHAWRERRTKLIGVFVLAMAFCEGVANDWLALALVDGHGVDESIGAAGYAVFLTAMTVGRLFGPGVLDRFGRRPVLRISIALSATGVCIVVLSGSVAVAVAGAVLWGVGVSLGFPIGMSAAADNADGAAARVSVVASIAYTSFLAGPPAVGWLADHFGVQHALLATVVLLVPALLVLPAVREQRAGNR